MNDYPKKLVAYLETLSPEDRAGREELYRTTLSQAIEHGLQSPRFWAARQVISGLNAGQIEHKIQKRIRRVVAVTPTHKENSSNKGIRLERSRDS